MKTINIYEDIKKQNNRFIIMLNNKNLFVWRRTHAKIVQHEQTQVLISLLLGIKLSQTARLRAISFK